ncbi:MAG: ligase-associated DNA damage response exonuclease [Hyphomonadaceae bacterium]
MRASDILCPKPEGLYCAPADVFIDPVRPVNRALITHGHSDHARAGHGRVMATKETLAIMGERYGADFAGETQAAAYGETQRIGDAHIRFAPAGHVLGSAQIVVEAGGKRIVVSGDYKRQRDPTCTPFEPVACDVFITEATFALPVFKHPPAEDEIGKLLRSVAANAARTHLVGAYALGKAQRIIALLREAGYEKPIYIHGAMERLCQLYEAHGVPLGPLEPATLARSGRHDFAGEIVICPPSAMADRWSRRFADPIDCFASGWMRVKQRAKQRGVELPLVISDHADWSELTDTIREIAPGELWITHGRDDALLRWAELEAIKARPLHLTGFEDEDD